MDFDAMEYVAVESELGYSAEYDSAAVETTAFV